MYVRHAARHIRASQENMIETFLRDYGWLGPDAGPYGAQVATLVRRPPREADLVAAKANTVYVSHGDELDAREIQLGGGLLRTEHILFVDILGENDGIALAIASDVKDRLSGLFGGTRYLRPVDQSTGLPLVGFLGEYEDVFREQPNPDLGSWQSVKATLVLDFPGENS